MKCVRRSEGSYKPESEDHWRDDNTCSYCGSFNPDTLMERIEAGNVELGPTDKSYKVYLENVNGPMFKQTYRDCPRDSECKGPDDCKHWVTRETGHSKFYFHHLSEEQMKRFVDLYNAKKIKIGEPGYFYSRPFFMQPA